jgi:S-formylglutathione hydrolase
MRSYIECELPQLIQAIFPADMPRQSIMGHSMGGQGILTIVLRHSDRFKSVSAFASIVSAMNCAWGEKALASHLGLRGTQGHEYGAVMQIGVGKRVSPLLVDQGDADQFLQDQLKKHFLQENLLLEGPGVSDPAATGI